MSASVPQDPCKLAMAFEKLGKQFYTDLSMICNDQSARRLFARMAKEEAAHYTTFERLQQGSRSKSHCALNQDDAVRLAQTHVLPNPSAVREVALGGNVAKAIELAIQMEQNSILFYRDIVSVLPDHSQELAQIIQEEQRHTQLLKEMATSLAGQARLTS